jgi:hypothetical protein
MYISKNLLYRLLWLCQYISQILAQATILPTATSLGIEQDIPEWSYHENIEKMYTTPIRSLDKHNILSLQTSLTKMLCAKVLTELNLIFIVYLYSQCLLIFYYVYQTNSTNQTWDLDETQRQQRIRSITFLATPTRHPAIPSFLPPPNTCTHNTKETFRNHCKRNYGSGVEETFPCLAPGGGDGGGRGRGYGGGHSRDVGRSATWPANWR